MIVTNKRRAIAARDEMTRDIMERNDEERANMLKVASGDGELGSWALKGDHYI